MTKTSNILALQCFLLGAYACNPGSGAIKGGGVNKGTLYEVGDQKGQTPGEPVVDSKLPPQTPTTQAKPAIVDEKIDSNNTEAIVPPGVITGAYLYCAVDTIDKERNKATSVCQLRDTTTKKAIDPSLLYKDIKWTALLPEIVEVIEIKDLVPTKSYWQASYSFKMHASNFKDLSDSITYKMSAVRISDGAAVKIEDKISSVTRPNFRLQSQLPHGAQALRCLDFSFDVPPDRKGTTGACRMANGQHMNLNPDGTIGLIFPDATQCISYDTGTNQNYVLPKVCNTNTAYPSIRWEIRGQELRMRGVNLCLSLTPTQFGDPDNDYIGVHPCTGAPNQRWEIIPF